MFEPDAAKAYSGLASPSFGGGQRPDELAVRLYYIALIWTPYWVKPKYLTAMGALTDTEAVLLATDRQVRWGRVGRCRSQLLAPDADVPTGWSAVG